MNSRPPSRYFRPQNRGAVIEALPASQLNENNARILYVPQWVLPYGDRTTNCGPAIVSANWRGCEGGVGPVLS
jgi:hypothetical protein